MPVPVTCFPTPDLAYMFSLMLGTSYMFSHKWPDSSVSRGRVQGLCIRFQKLFTSVTSQLCSSLVVHPPQKNPGSAPVCCMFSYAWHWLHIFPHDSQLTCFPMRGTGYMFPLEWFALLLKKGRLQIQRQTFCLISVPDVNDFGHLALFVKPKKGPQKKRANCDSQEINRWKLRGSILDSIIREGRDSVSVVQVALWTPFK